MRKNKALFALLTGALAAALFAVPVTAMAETTTIKQADFVGGVYTISEGGDYALGESVEGHINVNNTNSGESIEVTFDLGGNTLTSSSSAAAITVAGPGAMTRTLTVKNGTIVQAEGTNAALRVNVLNSTVTLEDLDVTSTNHTCLDAEAGVLNVNSGTYKVINGEGGNESVLRNGNNGIVNVKGGTFTLDGGSDIVSSNGSAAKYSTNLTGGSFSSFPSQAKPAESYVLLKSKGGNYEVVPSDSDKVKNVNWKVTGVTNFLTVYFEDGDEAKAFANEAADRSATKIRATVTFDPANGVDEPASYTVNVGSYASGLIDNPSKADGVFDYWTADPDKKTEFVLPTTPITDDITLTAVYEDAVATNGKKGYSSLQYAIDDNDEGGATITLLRDTTERVTINEGQDEEGKPADVNLTIDLGGKTLTSKADGDAITLAAKGTLTIKNGTIRADDDCLYVAQAAAGSTVYLEGDDGLHFVKNQSAVAESGCVFVVGTKDTPTTLNIMGGNYESAGTYAVRVDYANLNVTDGQFSNGQDEGDSSTILATLNSHVEFAGERVSGHICLENGSTANVHSGKFGDATNAGDVVEGKYLYKGDKEYYEGKDEYYEVLDYEDALDAADYVVYNEDFSTRVYFADYDDAEAYAASIGDESVIVNLYHVPFLVKGEQYYYHTYEVGEEIGELPEAPEFEDYTFAGWYVNGEKIDSTYKVNEDITVVAMWYWNGSSDKTPTDNPEAKGNKKLPQTGDPALAVSGLAAAGAALAGIGALRRRK